jgi:NMD protein affecting ribosome stability and mRNA decay
MTTTYAKNAAKPTCIECGAELRMKSACICADCMRKSMDPEELKKLLNPS